MLLRGTLIKHMQLSALVSSPSRQPLSAQTPHSLPAGPSPPRPISSHSSDQERVSANAILKAFHHISQRQGAVRTGAMPHGPAAPSVVQAQPPSASTPHLSATAQPSHDTQCMLIEPLSFLWSLELVPGCAGSSPALPTPLGTTSQVLADSTATQASSSAVAHEHTHDSFYHAAARDSSTDASTDMTALRCAVTLLTAGQAVAIPTETVYGLAANALNSEAVSRIFQAKQRPSDNPLIIHVSSMEMLQVRTGATGIHV